MGKKQEKALHGNKARIDPEKKMVGANVTNAVTLSGGQQGEPPPAEDENVRLARRFSEENQK